jgi:hypothetical protein
MSSCSLRIWNDFDENPDRGTYESFQMYLYDTDLELGVNPINKIRIENAVKLNLKEIGMSISEDPDLQVKYFVKIDQKEFIETCNNVYNDFEGGEYCIERVITYDEGTLVIDIIQAANQKIIWHGVAEGTPLNRMKNPDKKIKQIVSELIKKFQTYKINYLDA